MILDAGEIAVFTYVGAFSQTVKLDMDSMWEVFFLEMFHLLRDDLEQMAKTGNLIMNLVTIWKL